LTPEKEMVTFFQFSRKKLYFSSVKVRNMYIERDRHRV
jgi:hypothetical protein